MDLTLREHPARAARLAPDLRVLEVARLLLHEEPDPGRVARLREALRRDGVLRNPPIVAPIPEERAAVLDGANRITALRDLDVPHVVAQVVPYEDPAIGLSTWRHFVEADGAPLRDRIAALPGIRAVPVPPGAAEPRLARRAGIAAISDERGTLLLQDGGDPVAAAEALSRIVGVYRGRCRIHRVDGGSMAELTAAYGPGALVIFPPFQKRDILVIAARGGRLPTGITRHLIPGRALRVNTPLGWLAEPAGLAEKQAQLDDRLRQRWLDHGVRYYAEPTFLFDE
jgi:hypothetical protein